MSYETSSAATLFSQFHRLVLHEIAGYLPTDILQNLITVIKPNWHLKTELLAIMYVRMSEKDSEYLTRYKFPKAKTMPVMNTSCKNAFNFQMLSDANLCRISWVIDRSWSQRRNITEVAKIIQYMKNDSEDKEEPSLNELERRILSPLNEHFGSICTAFSFEKYRRIYQ